MQPFEKEQKHIYSYLNAQYSRYIPSTSLSYPTISGHDNDNHMRVNRPLQPQKSFSQPISIDSSFYLQLNVRQQPFQARMCGAGDKDRRVVDPVIWFLMVSLNVFF